MDRLCGGISYLHYTLNGAERLDRVASIPLGSYSLVGVCVCTYIFLSVSYLTLFYITRHSIVCVMLTV